MRFKRLDMNLLAALDVLIRTRNVSQAAEQMFITQSAMSNALARLRTYFDDPLLVKVGRRMELSPLAESLAGSVHDIMVRVENAVMLNPTFEPETSTREFTVVISDYSLSTLGPRLVREVARAAPSVRVTCRPQHHVPGLLLERGEIDLLIAPDFVCSENHPRELLFTDKLTVIACPNGRYANGVDMEAFRKAAHVVVEPFSGQESFASIALKEHGITPRAAISTYAFSSVPDFVTGTNNIALVQGRIAERAVAAGQVLAFEPPVAFQPLRQSTQWHQLRSRDPGLQWLRSIFQICTEYNGSLH